MLPDTFLQVFFCKTSLQFFVLQNILEFFISIFFLCFQVLTHRGWSALLLLSRDSLILYSYDCHVALLPVLSPALPS
jgi:hypothetical protein